MTPKKKNPQKRGRKPKADGEKFGQLSVRMPPKLRLGLELLASAQKRSLSEAMQWAVGVGLNSWVVGENRHLLDVVDELWLKPSHPLRVLAAYEIDRSMLTFEERATTEMIRASVEYGHLQKLTHQMNELTRLKFATRSVPKKQKLQVEYAELYAQHEEISVLLEKLITANWPVLSEVAAARANSARPLIGESLVTLSGLGKHYQDRAWIAKLRAELA